MYILHVGITMKAGQEQAAERLFRGPFTAAISAQEGFEGVRLLRPDDGGDHVLTIAFANRALQQKWVATELHGQVWPQMEANFAGYSVKTYTAV